MQRVIFHVDMDAFFASVEQRDNPELKGKPVIVGGQPGKRGVVAACSYEARVFGIHSAMPISEAYRRCPTAAFITPTKNKYGEVSKQIMELFSHYSPQIEQISVDEAFIDMTGTEKLLGTPYDVAVQIQNEMKQTLDLTCSVGIAPNKFLAKLASDMKKPAGITVTPFDAEEVIPWIAKLPIRKLWGVGAQTEKKLQKLGVQTVEDLQKLPESLLKASFGKAGEGLSRLRFGIDERPVKEQEGVKSVSNEHTFQEDITDYYILDRALLKLATKVSGRLRKKELKGRTITLTWRTADHSRHSSSLTISTPISDTGIIYETTTKMLKERFAGICAVRLIGLGVGNFDNSEAQLSLFDTVDNTPENASWKTGDSLMDLVSKKTGSRLKRGGEIE